MDEDALSIGDFELSEENPHQAEVASEPVRKKPRKQSAPKKRGNTSEAKNSAVLKHAQRIASDDMQERLANMERLVASLGGSAKVESLVNRMTQPTVAPAAASVPVDGKARKRIVPVPVSKSSTKSKEFKQPATKGKKLAKGGKVKATKGGGKVKGGSRAHDLYRRDGVGAEVAVTIPGEDLEMHVNEKPVGSVMFNPNAMQAKEVSKLRGFLGMLGFRAIYGGGAPR